MYFSCNICVLVMECQLLFGNSDYMSFSLLLSLFCIYFSGVILSILFNLFIYYLFIYL